MGATMGDCSKMNRVGGVRSAFILFSKGRAVRHFVKDQQKHKIDFERSVPLN